MTREEAIKKIKSLCHDCVEFPHCVNTDPDCFKALEIAIEALEQEPCEDCISRAELLKAIDTWDKFGVDDTNSLFRLDNLSLPHYVPYIHYDDVVKAIKGMPSIQPTAKENLVVEDCISRKAVMDYIKDCTVDLGCVNGTNMVLDVISNMPSIQPKPKTGHWIEHPHEAGENWEYSKYECSECRVWEDDDSDYCPNCGAKMFPTDSEKE